MIGVPISGNDGSTPSVEFKSVEGQKCSRCGEPFSKSDSVSFPISADASKAYHAYGCFASETVKIKVESSTIKTEGDSLPRPRPRQNPGKYD